jgi:nitrogen PTS system EIIA component
MELAKLLTPAAVRVVGQFTSKKRLFQELGEIAAQAYGLSAASAIDGLQERETLGPTGVGHGIALPHARLEDLKGIIGVFVRLEKPLDYDSVDRQPVDLVFGLFAPRDSGVDHLKALARLTVRPPAARGPRSGWHAAWPDRCSPAVLPPPTDRASCG